MNIVKETFDEPRSGSIKGLYKTVNILVSDFAQESNVIRNLLFISHNDDRPYRSAMDPFKALTIIKDDVNAGKFNRKIFEKFCYSLK